MLVAGVVTSGLLYLLFFLSSEKNAPVEQPLIETNQVVSAESTSGDFSGVGTFAELQAKGRSLECSFTYAPNEYESDVVGTYFIVGKNIRGDFVTNAPDLGGEVLTSLIINGDAIYVWSEIDGQSFGTKSPLEESDIQVPVAADQSVRYVCKSWEQVDRSIFVPPTTVLFKDAVTGADANMEYGTVYEEGEF